MIQPTGAELSLPLTRLRMSFLVTQLGLSSIMNTWTVGWGESLQLVLLVSSYRGCRDGYPLKLPYRMDGSFCRGLPQVCIKDAIFQPSTRFRHAIELIRYLIIGQLESSFSAHSTVDYSKTVCRF